MWKTYIKLEIFQTWSMNWFCFDRKHKIFSNKTSSSLLLYYQQTPTTSSFFSQSSALSIIQPYNIKWYQSKLNKSWMPLRQILSDTNKEITLSYFWRQTSCLQGVPRNILFVFSSYGTPCSISSWDRLMQAHNYEPSIWWRGRCCDGSRRQGAPS